jgi:hypothetical protein
MAKKMKTGFDNWDEVLAALAPKTRRKLNKRERTTKSNRRMRSWAANRDAARAAKDFVKTVIEGKAALARPGAGAHFSAPPRWPGLLEAMGPEREWTMSELRVLYDRGRGPTHPTVDLMIKRGLVEKRPNPDMRPARSQSGRADLWLYRRTESGNRYVASLRTCNCPEP